MRGASIFCRRIILTSRRSSGIQILPAVQQEAVSVTTFIRTATWVTPLQGFDQHTYTSQEKNDFEKNPQKLLDWRKETESNVNNIYSMFLNGSRLQESTKKRVTLQMEQRLHKPDLRQLLVPKWDFGCRRMTPGINYLETLQADNVTVVTGQVERITASGCVANGGKEYPVDVLICATGFDVSFRPRFSIKGKDGRDLRDIWSGEAHSYLGVGAPSQPNYFHFLGPNCPIGSGPLVGAIGKSRYELSLLASIHSHRSRGSSGLHASVVRPLANREDALLHPKTRRDRRLRVTNRFFHARYNLESWLSKLVQVAHH